MSTQPSADIPPTEIGSFDAFQPQNSEFIGSSSGVFFVNTVFRAFAKLQPGRPYDAASLASAFPDNSLAETGASLRVTVETPVADQGAPHRPAEQCSARDAPSRSYGIQDVGLGEPPPPAAAKQLLMLYFRHWHPFFPFLHGPTFLDKVNLFYNEAGAARSDANDAGCARSRLCRAITFQCVFNLAASAHPQGLGHVSRIKSPSSLTEMLGVLSSSHDMDSLQALVAAALYLVSQMSLRAASTVHGLLTRLIYHAGLHRCPFRYVQLPRDVCEMRKRLLWSAYVMDRYLSLALGHPLGLQDSDIDVCIPGMDEQHKPVNVRQSQGLNQGTAVEDVQEHLPDRAAPRSLGYQEVRMNTHGPLSRAPRDSSQLLVGTPHSVDAADQNTAPRIQGCTVTYFQLVGEVLELFHKSLHARSVTREKIIELTYKIHSWWNGLPAAFQDPSTDTDSSHTTFFTVSYHYLILLINRPFLSLPIQALDFRFALQNAIGASRDLVSVLRTATTDHFMTSWPVMLSAAWMAGLVLAFASLLDMYPFSKSALDIDKCLLALDAMSSRWVSASHCHLALRNLAQRLRQKHSARVAGQPLTETASYDQTRLQEGDSQLAHDSQRSDDRPSKRQKVRPGLPEQQASSRENPNLSTWTGENARVPPNWTPVFQYNGPDFGFDALQSALDQTAGIPSDEFDLNTIGLFNDMGWDGFDQSLGEGYMATES